MYLLLYPCIMISCHFQHELSNESLTRSNWEGCRGALLDSRVLPRVSSLLAFTRAKMMKSVWWGCSRHTRQISCEERCWHILHVDKKSALGVLQQTNNITAVNVYLKRVPLRRWGQHGSPYPQRSQLPSWSPCERPADTWEAETCSKGSSSPLSGREMKKHGTTFPKQLLYRWHK